MSKVLMSIFLFFVFSLNAWSVMSPCDHSHLEEEQEQHFECASHQSKSERTNSSGQQKHSTCLNFCCHFAPIYSNYEFLDLLGPRMSELEITYPSLVGLINNHHTVLLRPPIV